jgi:NADPH-dependent curcumin reductase
MTDKTRQILLAAPPSGQVKLSDFKLREIPLLGPSDGELLLRGCFLSLDPYMRRRMDDRESYAKPLSVGDVMPGQTVCVVEDSLGVLGMPGFTAYAGLRVIGKPIKGDTVVVSAAAGAVGSLAGQLAAIAGARAVGITGGPTKCAFVKEELGFDTAVDYTATGFPEALAMAYPDGIDIYFENVGGNVWQAVLPLLNQFARVPVIGIIAHYDGGHSSGDDLLPETMRQVIAKRLTLRGFINYDFEAEYFSDFLRDVSGWLKEGASTIESILLTG